MANSALRKHTISEHKVKASSTDGSPDYLDGKVDDTTLEVDSNQLKIKGISEISTDGTLGDNLDTALPTEKAVKTYVDNEVAGAGGLSGDDVDDFTIKFESNKLKVADRIEQNIMLTAFRLQIVDSRVIENLVDGIIDEYEDESGVDTGNSTNESYDSTDDYYSPVVTVAGTNANTKLLIHANDGDSSGQDHVPTYVGTAKIDGTRKFGSGACYFDGTDDYLYTSDSADWDIAGSNSDNWTIEFWVKHTDHVGAEYYMEQRQDGNNVWSIYHLHGSGIRFYLNDDGNAIDTGFGGEITDSDWHHIAICKVGSEYATYKDGIQVNYVNDTQTANFTGSLYIGEYGSGGGYFDGHMDEVRIIQDNPFSASPNSGLSDTITVPTSAHTSDSNTKLLLHFDGDFTDSGNTGHTINKAGGTYLSGGKFGTAGLQLDGNSDYIYFSDSADWDIFNQTNFTLDLWVRMLDNSGERMIFQHYQNGDNRWGLGIVNGDINFYFKFGGSFIINVPTSAGDIDTNEWYHVAVCKVGNDYGFYVNGDQVDYLNDSSSGGITGNLYIGYNQAFSSSYFNGNMDAIRITHANSFSASPNSGKTDTITVPTSLPTADADTKLLLNFEDGDIWGGHNVEPQGNAKVDRTTKKWGDGSWYFDGSGDYLELPDSADWDVVSNNTNDYTIDCWIYLPSVASAEDIVGQHVDGSNHWYFRPTAGGGIQFAWNNAGSTISGCYSSTGIITTSTWHHVALCKVGNDYGIYLDGTQVANAMNQNVSGTLASPLYVGWKGSGTDYFTGYIDELRITRENVFSASPNSGDTDTITVPTSEYSSSSETYNMTLISNSETAEAQPDTARIIIFEEDVDSITLNTDLKAYITRDGGVTYAEVTLTDSGNYSGNKRILSGIADLTASGIGAGTSMEYKIETLNNKDLKIHGTGVLWD